jgi:hypothetical protein
MEANPQTPRWTGPRFELHGDELPAPSLWRIARPFVGLAVVIGCLLLAVQESFRWAAQRPRPKAAAGPIAANQPAVPGPAAPVPAAREPAVPRPAVPQPTIPLPRIDAPLPEGADADPFEWADGGRRRAGDFHAEARKRHEQAIDEMHQRLDDMRRRHEAFRAQARKRHNDLLRRQGIGAPFDGDESLLRRVE